MATTVKMCNMSKAIAVKVFKMLNGRNIQLKEYGAVGTVILLLILNQKILFTQKAGIMLKVLLEISILIQPAFMRK